MKNRAPNLQRAVLYLDNEDNDGSADHFNNLLDHYRGYFRWLETRPPDEVPFRPGFYGHIQDSMTALLFEFPYLYVVDAAYEYQGRAVLDSPSLNQSVPNRVDFISHDHNAIPGSEDANHSGGKRNLMKQSLRKTSSDLDSRGPGSDWLVWPTAYQWEGNNYAALVPYRARETYQVTQYDLNFGRINGGTNWYGDYDSALVDDPAYPAVSPRLSLTLGPEFCVTRMDRSSSGGVASRSGDLKPLSIPAGGRPTGLPMAGVSDSSVHRSPDSRPLWLASPAHEVLIVAERLGWDHFLATYQRTPSGLDSVCGNILQAGPKLGPGIRYAGAAYNDDNAGIVVATPKGELFVAQAPPDSTSWNFKQLEPKVIHQYSQLTVASRGGQSVDAFFIDTNRVLHTAYHTANMNSNDWGNFPIDTNPDLLLPTTAIAACSPADQSLVVAAVGYNLQLYIYSWNARDTKYWVAPKDDNDALGGMLCAHTDLAIAWNKFMQRVEVLATDNEARLCLYQLQEDLSLPSRWKLTGRIMLDSPQAPLAQSKSEVKRVVPGRLFGDVAPNPFTDLILGFNSTGQRLIGGLFNFPPGFAQPCFAMSPAGAAPPAAPAWALME